MMGSTFKSGVKRFESQCYKINNRPVSLNEGKYRINFEPVDPKVQTPALHKFPLNNPQKRFFHIPPCVMSSAACSLSSRQQSKASHPQVFNSVIQIEGKFFKMRNLDNQLRRKNKHFEKNLVNTGDVKQAVDNRKSTGHSPP